MMKRSNASRLAGRISSQKLRKRALWTGRWFHGRGSIRNKQKDDSMTAVPTKLPAHPYTRIGMDFDNMPDDPKA
tara:strand:+ start:242337 stop:242558 length:222 start_codon:yes stop_codon:yes gene_type:complete